MEQYKSNPDTQFITLNSDYNPGLISPFLKEHHFTFVVIPASNYMMYTLKADAVPQNWIVDSTGVVRMKGLGYDATEKWETGMKHAIEKVKRGAATASSGTSR